ncbi:hypothetical protein J4573_23165 [Actinomadura barringtoniae]|uniref:Uncharacterized protein n=1 Tax=Actinomadura barringtoniae TaxID=1427535 RepID=A0A939T869_9ACTN|nr:hypothetical protein [Actinomadura barringtoniae]MBO2450022.1 hypothetical protein [Actinomadura barringtoniae]
MTRLADRIITRLAGKATADASCSRALSCKSGKLCWWQCCSDGGGCQWVGCTTKKC